MKPIETARLHLRPYTIHDFDALYTILSDNITMRFWPEPFSAEKTLSRIKKSLSAYDATGFGKFAVIHKISGRLIGDCGITVVEVDSNKENNLGYIIHHEFQGYGYGSEAAKACLGYAFHDLKLKRLTANMDANNSASIRVAEKIGMTKEKEFFNKNNRGILTCLYSLTV